MNTIWLFYLNSLVWNYSDMSYLTFLNALCKEEIWQLCLLKQVGGPTNRPKVEIVDLWRDNYYFALHDIMEYGQYNQQPPYGGQQQQSSVVVIQQPMSGGGGHTGMNGQNQMEWTTGLCGCFEDCCSCMKLIISECSDPFAYSSFTYFG